MLHSRCIHWGPARALGGVMGIKLLKPSDPLLKQKSVPVTDFGLKLSRFAVSLHLLMKQQEAIGIAAVQTGKLIRLIIVSAPSDSYDTPKNVYMVNPEIIYKSEDTVESWEGCLSVRGCYKVQRHKVIAVRYQTVRGEVKQLTGDGLFSVCCQHEIDHLNSVLISDVGVLA